MRVESNEKYKLFLQKVHEENIGDFEERTMSCRGTFPQGRTRSSRKNASASRPAVKSSQIAQGHRQGSPHALARAQQRVLDASRAFERVMQDKNKAISNIEAREEYEAARRLQLGSIIASVDNVYLRCCRNEAEVMRKAATLALSKKTASAAAKK